MCLAERNERRVQPGPGRCRHGNVVLARRSAMGSVLFHDRDARPPALLSSGARAPFGVVRRSAVEVIRAFNAPGGKIVSQGVVGAALRAEGRGKGGVWEKYDRILLLRTNRPWANNGNGWLGLSVDWHLRPPNDVCGGFTMNVVTPLLWYCRAVFK